MDLKTLESKKISDLRVIAQSLGIEAGSLKKNELISAISNKTEVSAPVQATVPAVTAAPTTEEPIQVRKRGRKPKARIPNSPSL